MACLGCVFAAILILVVGYVLNKFLRSLTIANLEKRAVFITGCDTGFGKKLALRLAAEGVKVFAGCLTESGAKSLTDEAGGNADHIETLIVDVTDDASVKHAAKHVEELLGHNHLWAIVNNAGILIYEGSSEWIPIDSYKKTIDVNTLGIVRVCNAFLPLLRRSTGRIVTVISCAGRIAIPPLMTYSVSKYAAEAYMDILRREVRHFGISCHILEPGVYSTPLVSAKSSFYRSRNAFDALSDDVKQVYGEDYLKMVDQSYYQTLEERANPNVEEVVDAYLHALTAKFPYLRYAVGPDAKFSLVPASFLPTWIQDMVIRLLSPDPVPDFELKQKKVG